MFIDSDSLVFIKILRDAQGVSTLTIEERVAPSQRPHPVPPRGHHG